MRRVVAKGRVHRLEAVGHGVARVVHMLVEAELATGVELLGVLLILQEAARHVMLLNERLLTSRQIVSHATGLALTLVLVDCSSDFAL